MKSKARKEFAITFGKSIGKSVARDMGEMNDSSYVLVAALNRARTSLFLSWPFPKTGKPEIPDEDYKNLAAMTAFDTACDLLGTID